jgi:hypothetical protein
LILTAAAALFLVVVFDSAKAAQLSNTFTHLIDHPAIGYKTPPPIDPVAIGWKARLAYREQTRSSDDEPISLADAAVEVVDDMLFVNEAPIEHTLKGSSGLTERFERQGPSDRAGRSLRQFDLRHRMMRFPCSYLIYAPVFDNLPGPAKSAIYRRLWEVLSGADHAPQYRRLSLEDRRAIVEILRDTKTDLPRDFQAGVH